MELTSSTRRSQQLELLLCPRTTNGLCFTPRRRRPRSLNCCCSFFMCFSTKPSCTVSQPPDATRLMWSKKNIKELDVAEWISTVVKDPMVEVDPITMSRHLAKATLTTVPAPSLWTGSYGASRGIGGFLVALGAAFTLASLAMAVRLFRSPKENQPVEYPSSDEENKLDLMSIGDGSEQRGEFEGKVEDVLGVFLQAQAVQHSLAVRCTSENESTLRSAEQQSSKPMHGTLAAVSRKTEVLQVVSEGPKALQAISGKTVQITPEAIQTVPGNTEALQAVTEKERAAQVVPKKTEALSVVPEMSEALQAVPEKEGAVQVARKVTEALSVVPEMSEALQAVPEKERAVQVVRKETEALSVVSEESEALQAVPEKSEALQVVPERPQAVQVVQEKSEALQAAPERPQALQVVPTRPETLQLVTENTQVVPVSTQVAPERTSQMHNLKAPAQLPLENFQVSGTSNPILPESFVDSSTGQGSEFSNSNEFSHVGTWGNDELDAEEKKNQEIRKIVRAAAPAMAIGAGAISFIHGVESAFEMVGLAATASLVSFELLWADARREFLSQMKRVTDHRKLRDFLEGRKIEYDTS